MAKPLPQGSQFRAGTGINPDQGEIGIKTPIENPKSDGRRKIGPIEI